MLELLLASAMVTMIGLTLYAAMGIGFRARGSAANQVSAMREAAVAMELVQQDLQSVVKPGGVLAGSFVGYAMGSADVKADSLEFHALGRDAGDIDSPLADGVRRVELALRTDVSPPVLVRHVERNLLALAQQEPEDEILARNVRSFGVRYYDGYSWLTEWDSSLQSHALPLAVELTIELNEPRPNDATKPYRLTQIVPLSCGQIAEETTE